MKGEYEIVCALSNGDITDDFERLQSNYIHYFTFWIFIHFSGTAQVSL